MKYALAACWLGLCTLMLEGADAKRVEVVVVIRDVLLDRAAVGSGKEERRFDVVAVDIVPARERDQRGFELMLPHDPAHAELKEKLGHRLRLSVTEQDLALH